VAAGATAKIAKDIVLLAQTEVAEVRERGPEGSGGSSTLPQKQNPIAAICAVANARQAPGLVATLLAAMDHEHQRAAGAWHAEWRPLSELLRAAGSAAACCGRWWRWTDPHGASLTCSVTCFSPSGRAPPWPRI
jgi:3-carboxy-cis,cis-muconate cycloisomerase